jgi:hypothetical protein
MSVEKIAFTAFFCVLLLAMIVGAAFGMFGHQRVPALNLVDNIEGYRLASDQR